MEDAANGGWDSPNAARRLIAKYPADALVPITKGISRSDASTRTYLLQILGNLPGDAVNASFLVTLKTGPELDDRLYAARELFARQHPELGPAIIHEWKRFLKQPPKSNVADFFKHDHDDDAEELITLLARIGNTETLRALAQELPRLSVERRSMVVYALKYREHQWGFYIDMKTPPLSPEAGRVAEELLASLLDDTDDVEAVKRISDLAAWALGDRWPAVYTFNPKSPFGSRNHQIAVIKNTWRGKQRLPAHPLPEVKRVARLRDNVANPALKKVTDAKSGRDRLAAMRELESLGLPSLPAVFETLKDLPADHAARQPLETLTQQLACVISDVQLAGPPSPTTAEFLSTVSAFKNQPLTAQAFVKILAAPRPNGTRGIKLLAERSEASDGIQLTVCLIPAAPAPNLPVPRWTILCEIEAGKESLSPFISSGSNTEPTKNEFDQIGEAIVKALAAPPQTPLTIGVSVICKQ